MKIIQERVIPLSDETIEIQVPRDAKIVTLFEVNDIDHSSPQVGLALEFHEYNRHVPTTRFFRVVHRYNNEYLKDTGQFTYDEKTEVRLGRIECHKYKETFNVYLLENITPW